MDPSPLMSSEEETPTWFVILLVVGFSLTILAGVLFFVWHSMSGIKSPS